MKYNSSNVVSFYDYLINKSMSVNVSVAKSSPHIVTEKTIRPAHINRNLSIESIIDFNKDILFMDDELKVFNSFSDFIKEYLSFREISLLVFDETNSSLVPLIPNQNSKINPLINQYLNEGILSTLFTSKIPKFIPVLSTLGSNGAKYNLFFIPFFDETKERGVLAFLTGINEKDIDQSKSKIITHILDLTLSKIDSILSRRKLNTALNDLMTYQAKLTNDFKLAAVGELTIGVAEEIISPLQVITTQVDFLSEQDVNKKDIDTLKSQIFKIQNSVNRLVKFSSNYESQYSIKPCNLNDHINEYLNITKSSFHSLKIDCAIDLDKNLPPVLSHPNYLFQIISNTFDVIKSNIKSGDGIILQTRFKTDTVILKFITSVNLSDENQGKFSSSKSISMSLKILENLMKKHEGRFEIVGSEIAGTNITYYFPIKRKIRI